MPSREHLVLCGGADDPAAARVKTLRLNLRGPDRNVHLRISDISRRLVANLPDVHADLLEVASYVYAADAAIGRGGKTDPHLGRNWRRTLRFVIPVRLPNLWSSDPVISALVETLTFLSDDTYAFAFRPLDDPPPTADFFEFEESRSAAFMPEEVILFSGGLDSLSGAIEELAQHGKRVALVSHRSAPKLAAAQKALVEDLRSRFGRDRVFHVPVWANVDVSLGRESTHRTRSFLFAALGAVTARLFGRDRIRFFENGVVSLNLPPVAQVVGARATRSTHPQALSGFGRVLSALLAREFDVSNPFAWRTKAEVIARIAENGCTELIRYSRSCTRVHAMTILHPHCGQCSQCIDRRFAVLAAGLGRDDPEEAYKVDLFTGARGAGPDREMALSYVRAATDMSGMADAAFIARYGEISRIVGFFPESADTVAGRILDLHRRHALTVCRVFDEAISAQRHALREGSLPDDCLLVLVIGRHGDGGSRSPPKAPSVGVGEDKPPIRIALDGVRKRVVFDRWGEVTRQCAELLLILAEPFREASRDERAPEHYPFIGTGDLIKRTHCDSDDVFRRRVLRCRDRISKLAKCAGDTPPARDDVIENVAWHGYRLNPDRVRLTALSDIDCAGQVTLISEKVTPLNATSGKPKG